jgi:hypothetical protein
VKGTQTQSDGRAKPVGTLCDDTFGNRLPTGEGEFDVAGLYRRAGQSGL